MDPAVYLSSSDELTDDPSHFNVLIMGKNGGNVDTLIFANINQDTQRVTLLSIPRDLYVNGRKINSVYGSYGIREQVRWVEDVVGYKIHKYILIDMYVFRDIIDLIGGIDVTLEEDLIDPTYKVCNDGLCSTLYYEAGTYHLNGTEALRIARSRHTTSDYSRAARQQLILEAIKYKALGLGVTDADTLLSLISTVLGSTETDISMDEAVRYFFRYQNFTLNRGSVMSSGNVLSAVPVPVDYVTSRKIQSCLDQARPETCTDTYAIDTLQPRDGDWDALKGWVWSVLR